MKSSKKIVISLILLAFIILLIFLTLTFRKTFILNQLCNASKNYVNSSNVCRTIYSYYQNEYTSTKIYSLNNKHLIESTKLVDNVPTTSKVFAENGQIVSKYSETSNKYEKVNSNQPITIVFTSPISFDNYFALFISAIKTSISSTECNGKECYVVRNFNSSNNVNTTDYYIDKETGLLIRSISSDIIASNKATSSLPIYDYSYEFDIVSENHFAEVK